MSKTANTKTLFHNSFSSKTEPVDIPKKPVEKQPTKDAYSLLFKPKPEDRGTWEIFNRHIPKNCIKCNTENKKPCYPMCLRCFEVWSSVPYINGVRQDFKGLVSSGECQILSDSDDD